MPNLSAQFNADFDSFSAAICDRDDALMIYARDVAKVLRGEIARHRIRAFLQETQAAALMLAKPDIGG